VVAEASLTAQVGGTLHRVESVLLLFTPSVSRPALFFGSLSLAEAVVEGRVDWDAAPISGPGGTRCRLVAFPVEVASTYPGHSGWSRGALLGHVETTNGMRATPVAARNGSPLPRAAAASAFPVPVPAAAPQEPDLVDALVAQTLAEGCLDTPAQRAAAEAAVSRVEINFEHLGFFLRSEKTKVTALAALL
jgi:hypothetical protein